MIEWSFTVKFEEIEYTSEERYTTQNAWEAANEYCIQCDGVYGSVLNIVFTPYFNGSYFQR